MLTRPDASPDHRAARGPWRRFIASAVLMIGRLRRASRDDQASDHERPDPGPFFSVAGPDGSCVERIPLTVDPALIVSISALFPGLDGEVGATSGAPEEAEAGEAVLEATSGAPGEAEAGEVALEAAADASETPPTLDAAPEARERPEVAPRPPSTPDDDAA